MKLVFTYCAKLFLLEKLTSSRDADTLKRIKTTQSKKKRNKENRTNQIFLTTYRCDSIRKFLLCSDSQGADIKPACHESAITLKED